MGPFFRLLADELAEQSIVVTKINFNAGDAFYFRGPEALSFRGPLSAWPAFLERLVRERSIDGIFLFGDGRPVHRAAVDVANRLGVPVFVFEEGYLRPDWVTLERSGVNGHSSMSRDPAFYRGLPGGENPDALRVGATFGRAGWYSTVYSIAMTLGGVLYPRYRHHRPLNAFLEAFRWVRGGIRKLIFQRRERGVIQHLASTKHKTFFLAALQVHCDYQLVHSPFSNVESFIEQVIESFARAAPADQTLVIKNHPMDRPYREYGSFIAKLARSYGLGDRVMYVHDLHLPTLLRHAAGVVMINSTVGLQALQEGTPVKVLGNAVYDMAGLTFQGSLDAFWQGPGGVDDDLCKAFRGFLLRTNQANGSFYRPIPTAGASGLVWPPELSS